MRWNVTKYGGNPVIDVVNNPLETLEQYVPAPIQLGNGDIWCYCKGNKVIYGWKSTDGGQTFSLQNGGAAVIALGSPGAWDSKFVLEPAAVYDAANNTIHLWYKGSDDATGATNWKWGHATAPDTTPQTFTKDAANPILSGSTVSADLGGGAVTDLAISDVIAIGTTYHFYGYASYDGTYRIIHASGTAWNNPSSTSILKSASGWQTVIQTPSVFTYGSLYGMLYAIGGSQATDQPRWVFAGYSSNGTAWTFEGDSVLAPGADWDRVEAYSASLLKTSTAPFSAPITDTQGRQKLYYSGLSLAGHANIGLAYMVPS